MEVVKIPRILNREIVLLVALSLAAFGVFVFTRHVAAEFSNWKRRSRRSGSNGACSTWKQLWLRGIFKRMPARTLMIQPGDGRPDHPDKDEIVQVGDG